MPFNDMRGNWSQRDQRRGQMFRDQHGRKYYATIELKTGDPTGLIEQQYQAPLVVPSMYLEKSKDPERPYDLFINYDRWLRDIDTERREWEKEARQRSMKLYGDKYRASDPISAEVLEIIGPPPQAREPVLAAKQGNSWILGLSPRIDMRLAKYFEPEQLGVTARPPEPDFSDPVDAEFEYADDAALEAEQDAAREAAKQKDRDRKARARQAQREPATTE